MTAGRLQHPQAYRPKTAPAPAAAIFLVVNQMAAVLPLAPLTNGLAPLNPMRFITRFATFERCAASGQLIGIVLR